jgi:hypothetical protein
MAAGSQARKTKTVTRLDSYRRVKAARFVPTPAMDDARERAIAFLAAQRLQERRAADGRVVGIQSTISTSADGENAMDLYAVIDGMVGDPEQASQVFAADPLRETWQAIADQVQARLGFPLEPELFSNMLFVAYLGGMDDPEIRSLSRSLLSTFRNSDVRGLYHFFTSLRFACDIDCTAVAAKARLVMGDIDPHAPRGAATLRMINDRILRSAAVCSASDTENASHGKHNGELRRHVFKVYLDDHEVQGAEFDRGLKNNPVVSANALFPVLIELCRGERSLEEIISLKEYAAGATSPRTAQASVGEIVAANLGYVIGFLLSGDWRHGCRYYGSPDAFLCACSELVHHFEGLSETFGLDAALAAAIEERRASSGEGIADPNNALNLALRAIAAANLGLDLTPELDPLVSLQDPDGGWSRFAPLYSFGSNHGPRIFFGSAIQTTAFAVRALGAAPSGQAKYERSAFLIRRLCQAMLELAAD